MILIGVLSLSLHFLGKWKETTDPFKVWFWNKSSVIYWITSAILCALALFMHDDWAPALGMTGNTYAVVVCYGGGHVVSRFLHIKNAAAEKKAQQ